MTTVSLMEFIRDFNSKTCIDTRNTLDLDEKMRLINAINIYAVDNGIRPACTWVENNKRDLYEIAMDNYTITKYCKNIVILGNELFVNRNYLSYLPNLDDNESGWLGLLLGYVSPDEENGDLSIHFKVAFKNNHFYLWSYHAHKLDDTRLEQLEIQKNKLKTLFENTPFRLCEDELVGSAMYISEDEISDED